MSVSVKGIALWGLAAVASLLLGAAPARGELAVLAGGYVLKVSSFQLEGERVRFELPSGGTMLLPLSRVERIVDDEIEARDEEGDGEGGGLSVSFPFPSDASVPAGPFGELIYEKCRAHDLNPGIVSAMARVESAYQKDAVSSKGARGLLQVMPATAERFGIPARDLFVPEHNLEAALRYLRWLVERFSGEADLVLAAYNAGEANVDRYSGVPPFRETRSYLRKIYALLDVSGAPGSAAGAR